MNVCTIIGSAAAVLSTVSLLPQLIKAHASKHTKDLSLGMYVITSSATALWAVYGIMLGQVPIIAANIFACSFSTYIIILKLIYG